MIKKYPELKHVGKKRYIYNGAFLKCFSIYKYRFEGVFFTRRTFHDGDDLLKYVAKAEISY